MGEVIPNRRFPLTTRKQREDTRRRFAQDVPVRRIFPPITEHDLDRFLAEIDRTKPKS